MPFYSIQINPDIIGSLSETYGVSTARTKEFVLSHDGKFYPAVKNGEEDAGNDGKVYADLPVEAALLLETEDFIDSVGDPIVRSKPEQNGDRQDGLSPFTDGPTGLH